MLHTVYMCTQWSAYSLHVYTVVYNVGIRSNNAITYGVNQSRN